MLNTLLNNVRYALRGFAKRPGFVAVVVLSLALGIGANTAIFTVVNAIFLKPIPVGDPQQLVQIYTRDERNPGHMPLSLYNFRDVRDKTQSFAGVVGAAPDFWAMRTDGQPIQIFGELVSGNYFDVMQVKPVLGRTFRPEEDTPRAGQPVTVISNAFWRRQFGANPKVLGQKILLNGYPYTVIGVAPPNFEGANAFGGPDAWAPLAMFPQLSSFVTLLDSRRFLGVTVLARLKPGVTRQQANAEVGAFGVQLAKEYPNDNRGRGYMLMPLTDTLINPDAQTGFVRVSQLLMTVVGLVLLIACANIANLLLVRAASRRKEIAIRLSIGAGRANLIGQLLTESFLLAIFGGAVGLVLATWGIRLLWSFRPPFLNEGDLDLHMDAHVLLFTLGISLLTGLLFGLMPALDSLRPELVSELKDRSSAQTSRSRFPLRNILVVAQVAFSLMALIGAGLFLRSMRQAQNTDPGFASRNIAVLTVNPGGQGYTPERAQIYFKQVLERVSAIPGVTGASFTSAAPLGFNGLLRSIYLEGESETPGRQGILTAVASIYPGYFETMKIPVERGRAFTDADRQGARPVAIINQTAAKKFWPGQDPVGKRFKFHGDQFLTEVIGIAKDSKYQNISEDPRSYIYSPALERYSPSLDLVFRTPGDPAPLLGVVRQQVQNLDPAQLITNVFTMPELINRSLWAQKMGGGMLAVFGALALLMSAVGLYGVMAYTVSQRTSELGIRMALGAGRADVFRIVLRDAMVLVSAGVILGIVAALALTRFLETLLVGVGTADLTTFFLTSLVLVLVALLATLIPARRATVIDPLIALRAE